MGSIDHDILDRFRGTVGDTHEPARLYAEGAALLAAGDADAAVEHFESALSKNDTTFGLKMAHGLCAALIETGRAVEAESVARVLLDERPDLLTPYLLLGLCLLRQKRFDEALAVHERALDRDGEAVDVTQIIADGAVALDSLGRYADGVQWCIDGLARLSAPSPTLTINLAVFQIRLGELADAREALLSAREIAPDVAPTVESIWADFGDGRPL